MMLTKYFLHLIVFVLTLSFSTSLADKKIFVSGGIVTDLKDSKPIDSCKILIKTGRDTIFTTITDSSGQYEPIGLDFNYSYQIIFAKPNYLSRSICIRTPTFPNSEQTNRIDIHVEMALPSKKSLGNCLNKFEITEGEIEAFLTFNKEAEDFIWSFTKFYLRKRGIDKCLEKNKN